MTAKRFLRRLSNNFGFKVLALVLAVIIWLVIVNIEDPEKSRVFTVPVTVENEEFLTEQGMSYEVEGTSDITFTVSGARTIVEDLSESDFKATADLEEINSSMTKVPVRITVTRFNSGLELQKRTQYLNVSVEKIISKDLAVEVEMKGDAPSNRNVAVASVNPETITVTGPESLVKTLKSAGVSADISSGDEDFSTNSDISLTDEDGKTVESSELTLSDTKATIQFSVDALKEISLTARTSGTPAEGYQVTAISCSPEKVTVSGEDEVLDSLTELELTSEELDATGRSEDFYATVPISSALPQGVVLADGAPTKATVNVTVEPYETKEISLPTKQIKVLNLPEQYSLTFDEEQIAIVLKGTEEQLQEIDAAEVTGSIDAGAVQEGSQSVALSLDGSWTLEKNVTVPVTIRQKEQ